MGTGNQTKYVNANELLLALSRMYSPSVSNYSSGLLDQQVNNLVNQAFAHAFEGFKQQLMSAVTQASVPYDKCMLCVQRDSCIPEHPLGDNR